MKTLGRFLFGLAVPALLGGTAGFAYAQTLPDAGALRRQIEQASPLSVLTSPSKGDSPAPPTAVPSGFAVRVRQFSFSGNHLMSDEQLAKVLATWVDRDLDLAGLQGAQAAVVDAYRAQGWLVRVTLPRQEIVGGVVQLDIVEAQVGKVAVEGRPARRVPRSMVEAVVRARLQQGAPLDNFDLDRGLMLADDLPGVVVAGRLAAGSQQAQTDVLIQTADEPIIMGEAMLDNFGEPATDNLRLSTNVAFTSPLGFGDLISSTLSHTRGSDYVRVDYTVPVGVNGLRVGANASVFRYRLLTDAFKALDAKGQSSGYGLHASYPVIRSRKSNLYLETALDHRSFNNRANGETLSDYAVDDLSVSGNLNHFDELGGGGVNAFSLSIVDAHVDLSRGGDVSHAADDASGPRVAGSTLKLRYAASRQQVLTQDHSMYLSASGQWANKNQDSSEKFYLGGPYGVRAYPVDEGGGSRGILTSIELRTKWSRGWVSTIFYDWGQVTVNADNNYPSAPAHNRFALKGAGLSLSWQGPMGVTFKGIWARRIGSNPNSTHAGLDQDGTLIRNRFWFSANLSF